jgi:hypothetical protein
MFLLAPAVAAWPVQQAAPLEHQLPQHVPDVAQPTQQQHWQQVSCNLPSSN